MSVVYRLNYISGLQRFAVPLLRELAADPDLEGSVRNRVDPLLQALPATHHLTGRAIQQLGLNDHEAAYLMTTLWGRPQRADVVPGTFDVERLMTDALAQAQSENPNHPEYHRPRWLTVDATYFTNLDVAPIELMRPSGGMVSSDAVSGHGYISYWNQQHLQIAMEYDAAKLNFVRDGGVWKLHRTRQVPYLDPYRPPRRETLPLLSVDDLPTHLLQACRSASARRNSTPPKEYVTELHAAIDEALARRDLAADRRAAQVLEDWRTGKLTAMVGPAPKASVVALARAIERAATDGGPAR